MTKYMLSDVSKSVVAIVALIILGSALYGFRLFGIIVSEKESLIRINDALQRTNTVLCSRVTDLSNEASRWKNQAEEDQVPTKAITGKIFRADLAESARIEASSVLDFQSEINTFQPATILAACPGGQEITKKSFEENSRYQRESITVFLKNFSAPISGIVRRAKPFGVDISRLQHHMDAMVNTMMIQLVGEDLNDHAEQLDPTSTKPVKPQGEQAPMPSTPESPS